ncbi:MAG: ABC transporter substrate-binding protein [Methanosarcinales archaeon]|nr:ABC transporter substrate-binding protein [Methanosarcinales archaeon]
MIFSIGIVAAESPERIVSLAPSNTEILFAIGAGDRMVGVTTFCDYPTDAKDIEKLGGFYPDAPEKIVNATPDIIFARPHNKEMIEGIGKTNITIFIDEKNVEDIFENIKLIGTHIGNLPEAETLVNDMQSQLQIIENVVEGIPINQNPRILYITWHGPIFAAGPDSFIGNIINIVGGINVVEEGDWSVIGIESIVDMNPDVIIASNEMVQDGIITNPALSGIDAVANGKVFVMNDENIISRPGPRIVDGIEDMHSIILQNLKPELEPEPKPVVPGFGIVATILGFFVLAKLMQKKNKK